MTYKEKFFMAESSKPKPKRSGDKRPLEESTDQPKPKKQKKIKGSLVNHQLSTEEITQIITWMKKTKIQGKKCNYIEEKDRGWMCNLAATTTKSGDPKYPQVDITKFHFAVTGKVLVHHLFWRFQNNGALMDLAPDMHISHLDKDKKYIECVQESKDMNESRKYCHLFSWYKVKAGEGRARCPHSLGKALYWRSLLLMMNKLNLFFFFCLLACLLTTTTNNTQKSLKLLFS